MKQCTFKLGTFKMVHVLLGKTNIQSSNCDQS